MAQCGIVWHIVAHRERERERERREKGVERWHSGSQAGVIHINVLGGARFPHCSIRSEHYLVTITS